MISSETVGKQASKPGQRLQDRAIEFAGFIPKKFAAIIKQPGSKGVRAVT
jgi:hypothetical protein